MRVPSAVSAAPAARSSVVIPTYNEADQIERLIRYLRAEGGPAASLEIIVADGQSTDETVTRARHAGACVLTCPRKGRGAQMNFGAAHAAGDILYFLHADTYPPPDFARHVRAAVAQGAGSGCFRLAFDDPHWFLRANAWFTRFNVAPVRFGDQSLFVRRPLFEQAQGYRADLLVFEDQEIIHRLKQLAPFRVLRGPAVTSARKYRENGVFRLQGIFALITVLYRLGASQTTLVRVYRKLIRQDKM
jgi:rSAM/selenodomain-associated transferase 2